MEDISRHLVVAVDLSDQSLKTVQYTAYEICRPRDKVHLVHIAKILSPQYTIQHGYAGSSYNIPNTHPVDEGQHIAHIREIIKDRFSADLDRLRIPHSLHIFLDTDNAPASAVCDSIFKVARDYSAELILLACHNKAYGWDTLFLGSVADLATQNSDLPVMIVRDYKPPIPLSASSPNSAAVSVDPLGGLTTKPDLLTNTTAHQSTAPHVPFVITASSHHAASS